MMVESFLWRPLIGKKGNPGDVRNTVKLVPDSFVFGLRDFEENKNTQNPAFGHARLWILKMGAGGQGHSCLDLSASEGHENLPDSTEWRYA